MQPKDAANAMTMMSDKLSDSIQEMPSDSVLDKMRIEACKQICQDISDLMVVCVVIWAQKNRILHTVNWVNYRVQKW